MSVSRLHEKYRKEILPNFVKMKKCNPMRVARLKKITLNMGVGEAALDKKVLDFAAEQLSKIAGQKAQITYARKSIAGFKIREGWPIGCKVTLRREKMYEFLDRLISIYLPRVRDFRGVSRRGFDGRGNFAMGVKEQTICPEIDFEKIDALRGFDICITMDAESDQDAYELLAAFKFPFREAKV
ncbi:MAG: 50S ribosomal protein L5 [Gammaproteobacteria bacterium]